MVKCRKSGNFGRSKTIGARFIMSLYLAHSIESMRQFNYKAKTRLSARFSNNSAFSFLTKVAFFFFFHLCAIAAGSKNNGTIHEFIVDAINLTVVNEKMNGCCFGFSASFRYCVHYTLHPLDIFLFLSVAKHK